MSAKCPRAADAAAFVSEELPPGEQGSFEKHLASCAECSGEVHSIRRLLGRLHTLPAEEPACDLAPAVLAQARDDEAATAAFGGWWKVAAALAAMLAVLAGVGTVLQNSGGKPVAAALATRQNAAGVSRALDWLCQTQEPEGSWNPERWGGNRRFEIALTALPVLALLNDKSPAPQHLAAVKRATEWLRKTQTAGGAFGPEFQGAVYNHSIATLALVRAYQHQPDAETRRALNAAIANILERQNADGGWGYLHSHRADRSISEWHLEALVEAVALGWEDAREPVARGREWLARHALPETDALEPRDSPSVALAREVDDGSGDSIDFYRAYFLTAALQHAHDVASQYRLAEIRQALLLHQESAGSWPADDRWGRAGGRLYSTALASLSLQDR